MPSPRPFMRYMYRAVVLYDLGPGTPDYVQSAADGQWTNNLLALPRLPLTGREARGAAAAQLSGARGTSRLVKSSHARGDVQRTRAGGAQLATFSSLRSRTSSLAIGIRGLSSSRCRSLGEPAKISPLAP